MLQKPEHQQRIATLIAELQIAQAAFDKAHEVVTAVEGNASTLQAAANAARADAERLRGEVRELLRQVMGRPSKELRARVAEQQAALALASDYEELVAELQPDIQSARVQASEPAKRVEERRTELANTHAALIIEEVITEIAPRLQSALSHQASYERSRRHNHLLTVAYYAQNKDADDMVFEYFGQQLRRAVEQAQPEPMHAEVADALAHTGIGSFTPLSPCQIHVMRHAAKKAAEQRA